ncbi:hypothetical protein GCM10020219_053600 [Nonomuraea dietziae]
MATTNASLRRKGLFHRSYCSPTNNLGNPHDAASFPPRFPAPKPPRAPATIPRAPPLHTNHATVPVSCKLASDNATFKARCSPAPWADIYPRPQHQALYH